MTNRIREHHHDHELPTIVDVDKYRATNSLVGRDRLLLTFELRFIYSRPRSDKYCYYSDDGRVD